MAAPNSLAPYQVFARREAVESSRIEGTQASLSELALSEQDPRAVRDPDDVREVANYLAAISHMLDPERRLPSHPELGRTRRSHNNYRYLYSSAAGAVIGVSRLFRKILTQRTNITALVDDRSHQLPV
jgi:Fic family protein